MEVSREHSTVQHSTPAQLQTHFNMQHPHQTLKRHGFPAAQLYIPGQTAIAMLDQSCRCASMTEGNKKMVMGYGQYFVTIILVSRVHITSPAPASACVCPGGVPPNEKKRCQQDPSCFERCVCRL